MPPLVFNYSDFWMTPERCSYECFDMMSRLAQRIELIVATETADSCCTVGTWPCIAVDKPPAGIHKITRTPATYVVRDRRS